MTEKPRIRFAAIGLNHDHIYGQTNLLLNAGAELVWVYATEADLLQKYQARFPQATLAPSEEAILEDESIHLVISAAIPYDRAPLGVRVMRHGKDYMSDKPGFTTLEQLAEARRVQAETQRVYSIDYSERFENRATTAAGELVHAGAIGKVLQTIGMGPHRTRWPTRAPWFVQRDKVGGILTDIASHQFDQFLHFTGAQNVEIVASQVANYHHPQHPEFEDFGDVMVRAEGCSGYIRVDWFTPDGLDTWGDTRLFVIGTEGTIEVRKNIDIAGRQGSDHLFLVDKTSTRYIDCRHHELPYGRQLLDDIANRTQTAMTQEHCFYASELALRAQAQAVRLGNLA
jgi:predicted dehydrogenase